MANWIDRLTYTLTVDAGRAALGRRLESVTDEAFNMLRWSFVVGMARFLALQSSSVWLDAIHWMTSAMLFGYLASRFLLRPEVAIFAQRDRRWKRIAQTLVNLALCLVAFVLVLWALNLVVEGVAQYRFGSVAL